MIYYYGTKFMFLHEPKALETLVLRLAQIEDISFAFWVFHVLYLVNIMWFVTENSFFVIPFNISFMFQC